MVRQPLARAKLKLVRLQFLPFAKVLGLLLSAFLAASAHAQQASTPAPSPTGVPTDQELAKTSTIRLRTSLRSLFDRRVPAVSGVVMPTDLKSPLVVGSGN